MGNLMRGVDNDKIMMVAVVIIGWVVLYPLLVMGSPIRHKVGGSKGWHQDVNYTDWSSQQKFYVGDWLFFVFDKHYYNVLEVNKTSYENCIDKDFIKNETRGGRDVVQLKEARTYYYISGGGYCFHQMKVAVLVEQQHQAAIAPAPVPTKSGTLLPSVFTCTWIILANVLFMNLLLINGCFVN